MTSQDYVGHIVSRIRADIDFLVSLNVMSTIDAQVIAGKLPARAVAPLTPASPVSMASPAPTPVRTVQRPLASTRNASQNPQARALWAYNIDGQEGDDLSFGVGETIEILEEINADWCRGQNARGETGLFPSNHVEKISVVPSTVPAPPTRVPGGRMIAPPPNGKFAYDPMAAPPAQQAQGADQQAAPPKKNKFGKLGNTMAQSAAGGVGFGAGAAIGGGIVRAIF